MTTMNEDLAEARARAGRNGLELTVSDSDPSPAWPGQRYASVHLMRGDQLVAGVSCSYPEKAGPDRALSFCAKQVFLRPD